MLASPENTDDLGTSTPSSCGDAEEVQLRRQALHDVSDEHARTQSEGTGLRGWGMGPNGGE